MVKGLKLTTSELFQQRTCRYRIFISIITVLPTDEENEEMFKVTLPLSRDRQILGDFQPRENEKSVYCIKKGRRERGEDEGQGKLLGGWGI
jgi:hypothetical protein